MKAVVMGCALVGLVVIGVGAEQAANRFAEIDKGPATIDVSGYPAEMQANYKVFADKCGKCHTLARAVNSDLATEGEWDRYIKRMMRRAGKFITPDDGKQIYDFAVYDSKTRKKELYDKKIKEEAGKPSGL